LILEKKKQVNRTKDVEVYQIATAFSRDRSLVAVGTTDNVVSIISYPSLVTIAAPFQIPKGKLYTLDFSETTLLIATDAVLYIIPLPLNIEMKGKGKAGDADRVVRLPQLEASATISVPAPKELEDSGNDEFVQTFRSAKFNPKNSEIILAVVNSAPGRSRKKKVDRKSYLTRWELSGATVGTTNSSKEGLDIKWILRKVRCIGKRAITVFEISKSGNLAAYGASDSSVGIVEARALSPLVTILKVHEFPPTTLQFNPSSTLLVSGSADASVRVIVVPTSFTSSTLPFFLLFIALLIIAAAILIHYR